MELIATNRTGILRDPNSKALIIKDDVSKKLFKEQMEEKKRINNEISNLKSSIEEYKTIISREMFEIKNLVIEFAEKRKNK